MLDQDTNERAVIGDNNPPDPIEECIAEGLSEFQDYIEEAQNWLDGEAIDSDEQMAAVDEIIAKVRTRGTTMEKLRTAFLKPHNDAITSLRNQWKVHTDDNERTKTLLVKLVAPYKKKLQEEADKQRRLEWERAQQAEREAEALRAAAETEETNIEAVREAEAAEKAAKEQKMTARLASKPSVKGMRTVHHHKVESGQDVIDWIIRNDLPALQGFLKHYVEKHPKKESIDGVKTWQTKEAY